MSTGKWNASKQHLIQLSSASIGEGQRPFVIAELSGNHNHSLDRALQIVEAAANAGADGLKLQTYTADTMTIDCRAPDFVVQGTGDAWRNRTLYELYDEAHTPWEWHQTIFRRCYELGMVPFSTPFDETSVDFLEELEVEIYKIASFELVDTTLLKKVAGTGKPVILSTGMASEPEVENAVATLRQHGSEQVVLLKCTSAYPAEFIDANLATIPYFSDKYSTMVGLSDHTMGAAAPVAATALGAHVIEKHLTLNRSEGGVDSHFSMEPKEFASMTRLVREAFEAVGTIQTSPGNAELACRNYRKSLYAVEDIKADEPFSDQNVRAIRPGFGLAPVHYERILGKRASRAISKGTALSMDLVVES